jgi:hypothetical protein
MDYRTAFEAAFAADSWRRSQCFRRMRRAERRGRVGSPLAAGALPLGTGTQLAPKYLYLFSPTARWMGPLRWRYNHAGAPAALATDKAAIVAQITKSFEKWSSQCGITYVYEGETTVAPNSTAPDGVSVVGWGTIDPGLGAWTYAWYRQEGSNRVIFDADVTLSAANVASLSDLDRPHDARVGPRDGSRSLEYGVGGHGRPASTHYNALVTPQADDLRGCRCQYGLSRRRKRGIRMLAALEDRLWKRGCRHGRRPRRP